jgi:hypothetical protein
MTLRHQLLLGGLCVLIAGLSACRPDAAPGRETSTLVGRIQMIGNEPFTSLSLETISGEVFVLNCDEALAQYLQKNQGKTFQITCTTGEMTPRGRSVNVVKAEQLPNGGR